MAAESSCRRDRETQYCLVTVTSRCFHLGVNIMTEVDMQAVRERLDREEEQLQEERQALQRDYIN